MKLQVPCAAMALMCTVWLQAQVRADYLQTPGSTAGGSTSVSSVSTPSANSTPSASNAAPAVMVDNHDAGWNWSSMVEYDDPNLFGKSGYTGGPGSYGVYNFHGTGVEITGMAGPSVTLDGVTHTMGSIVVFIDGKQVAVNSLHLNQTKYRDSIFKVDGLDAANHVLHIEPIGGWIVVNFITVLNSPPQPNATHSQDSTSETNYSDEGLRLFPQGSNTYCLDVPPGPLKGALLDLWHVDTTRIQTWILNPVGNGQYTLSPAGHSDVVLWMVPVSPNNKTTQLFLWSYTGAPNELLTIKSVDPGSNKYTIQSQKPVTALGVTPAGYGDGAVIQGQILWGPGSQMWNFQKVGN